MKLRHIVLLLFFVVLTVRGATAPAGTQPEPKLKTGLFVDFGSRGAGAVRWARLLHDSPQIDLRLLDGNDLVAGKIHDLDLLVMPGGSSFTQWDSMQHEKGGNEIKKYVRNGGKYFGTCAGMSLILNEKNRVTMMPFVRTPGEKPGGFTAKIKLNAEGQKLLGLPEALMMRYHNGPIVRPSDQPLAKISCQVLGSFDCEVCQHGQVVRPLYGSPAFFRLFYDKGELLVTNCHPEIYTCSHPVIVAGIKMLTGRTVELVYPAKKPRALRVAFYCPGMGGKKPIEEMLAMADRPDVDLFPATDEDVLQGILEHADVLYVSPGAPDDAGLFARGREGELIRAFATRGGKIIRSMTELQ